MAIDSEHLLDPCRPFGHLQRDPIRAVRSCPSVPVNTESEDTFIKVLLGAALAATVDRYNAAIRPGATDRTIRDGKATSGIEPAKSNWATPIQSAPFIGYPLTCAITFTFGGVRSDARARVIRQDGTPIEGLYAAGEVTGLYYKEYPAGTSVLRALTFGRIAAREAAGTRS
jgi:tricarballylate dehydrogenase